MDLLAAGVQEDGHGGGVAAGLQQALEPDVLEPVGGLAVRAGTPDAVRGGGVVADHVGGHLVGAAIDLNVGHAVDLIEVGGADVVDLLEQGVEGDHLVAVRVVAQGDGAEAGGGVYAVEQVIGGAAAVGSGEDQLGDGLFLGDDLAVVVQLVAVSIHLVAILALHRHLFHCGGGVDAAIGQAIAGGVGEDDEVHLPGGVEMIAQVAAGDGGGQGGQVRGGEGAVRGLFIDTHALAHGVAAQGPGGAAVHPAGEHGGGGEAQLPAHGGGDGHQLAVECGGRGHGVVKLERHPGAQQAQVVAGDKAHGIAGNIVAAGTPTAGAPAAGGAAGAHARRAGHPAVGGEEQGKGLAQREAGDGVHGVGHDGELIAAGGGDHRGGLGGGGGILVVAEQPHVAHVEHLGHGVVGEHVVCVDVAHGDHRAVLADGVVVVAAGEGGKARVAHRALHHQELALGGAAAQVAEHADNLAVAVEIDGDSVSSQDAGAGGGKGAHLAGGAGVYGGAVLKGVAHAGGGVQVVALHPGHGGGDAQGGVGEQGDEAPVLVQEGRAPLAYDGGVNAPGGAVGAAGGHHPAGLAVDGGVGGEDDGVLHQGAQAGGIGGLTALGGGGEQPAEQNGGLAPGEGGGGVGDAKAVFQPHLHRQLQSAHWPGAVGVVVVAQHTQDEGDSLLIGDVPVGLKAAAAGAHHQPGVAAVAQLHSGGQVHIAPAPVGAGHVGEDGAAHLGLGLVAPAHDLDGHLAELHPGQGAVGLKGAVLHAVDDAQGLQGAHRPGHGGVGHVGEGAGLGGRGGQGEYGGQRQQGGKHAFEFHMR